MSNTSEQDPRRPSGVADTPGEIILQVMGKQIEELREDLKEFRQDFQLVREVVSGFKATQSEVDKMRDNSEKITRLEMELTTIRRELDTNASFRRSALVSMLPWLIGAMVLGAIVGHKAGGF